MKTVSDELMGIEVRENGTLVVQIPSPALFVVLGAIGKENLHRLFSPALAAAMASHLLRSAVHGPDNLPPQDRKKLIASMTAALAKLNERTGGAPK